MKPMITKEENVFDELITQIIVQLYSMVIKPFCDDTIVCLEIS